MTSFYKFIFRAILSTSSLLFSFDTSYAQPFVDLKTAADFVLFTKDGAVGNTGISQVIGKIGTNLGAITGFTPITGQQEIENLVTLQAAADLDAAFLQLWAHTGGIAHAPLFGNGETLSPGVYEVGEAASISGILTLDAHGEPHAHFIFKIVGALNSAASTQILLLNGALAKNIYWGAQGGAIAFATLSDMKGNFIASPGAVSAGADCLLEGRMLSTTGAIAVYGIIATTIPALTLPASIKDFYASGNSDAVDISWTSLSESSLRGYELEKSADGQSFTKLGLLAATNTSTTKKYSYRDKAVSGGISYYRLKIVNNDGGFKYSAVVRIDIGTGKGISIYPNPVTGHVMNLQMLNQSKGKYEISVYNLKTEKIATKQITHSGMSASYSIPLRNNIPAGTYYVKIAGQQGNKKTFKIIVE